MAAGTHGAHPLLWYVPASWPQNVAIAALDAVSHARASVGRRCTAEMLRATAKELGLALAPLPRPSAGLPRGLLAPGCSAEGAACSPPCPADRWPVNCQPPAGCRAGTLRFKIYNTARNLALSNSSRAGAHGRTRARQGTLSHRQQRRIAGSRPGPAVARRPPIWHGQTATLRRPCSPLPGAPSRGDDHEQAGVNLGWMHATLPSCVPMPATSSNWVLPSAKATSRPR